MLSYIVAIVAVVLVIYSQSGPPRPVFRAPLPTLNEDLVAISSPNDTLDCPPDRYSVHIYSKEPLVIYIENFLSKTEREDLLNISAPLFKPSTITHDGTTTQVDPSIRLSEVAFLPRTPSIRCLESRARAFQGWRRNLWIERLRTQRYGAGGHYGLHYDWSTNAGGWGRVSSFMVWADKSEDMEGGGTEFPYLPKVEVRSGDKGWCRLVECDGGWDDETGRSTAEETVATAEGRGGPEEGVVFKVIPGNAVFWENFRADGSGKGYPETFHAGLPVKQGTKIGLNIWTWGALE